MGEIFFSILSRETLKGSSFRDTNIPLEVITVFVNEHKAKAKPFFWRKRDLKDSRLRNTIVNLIIRHCICARFAIGIIHVLNSIRLVNYQGILGISVMQIHVHTRSGIWR